MRISTNSLYEVGTAQLGTLQGGLVKIQQQLSTGRRNLTAADDPIAAARALAVIQSQSINDQFATNRQNARSSLTQVEVALSQVTSLIQDVQTLAVSAGNGGLSNADRGSIATELQGRLTDLLGLANSADAGGGFLFSGFRSNTLPFLQTVNGAAYQGDQGQRVLQVAASRSVPASDSGSSVFENNVTGNGTFQTNAVTVPPNVGSGIISGGAVSNLAALTGENYAITFAVSPDGVTTYDVLNTTTGVPVAQGSAYTSGQQIAFDGIAFDIKGAPANGDSFTVVPSQKQSIFTTLTDLIATLRAPSTGAVDQAKLTNGLNTAQINLSNSLDNVLSVRATIGANLKELDSLDSSGDDLGIQYSATLASLQDLDTVKAISLFSQQELTLQAAQKSFKTLTGLSLFNFIG